MLEEGFEPSQCHPRAVAAKRRASGDIPVCGMRTHAVRILHPLPRRSLLCIPCSDFLQSQSALTPLSTPYTKTASRPVGLEAVPFCVYASSSSSSSISWPNSSSASLTGCGVLTSTPAILSRETGSAEQPPERKER